MPSGYGASVESQHPSTDQWSTYEANVQSYRGLAVSAQSLFLAVGAILLEDRLVPFLVVFAFAMLATWWVFFPVIFARTAVVDFHKFDLAKSFDRAGRPAPGSTDPLRETEYARVTNRALRRAVYGAVTSDRRARLGPDAEPFRTLRQTRLKLDLILPLMFSVVWVTFAVYAVLA